MTTLKESLVNSGIITKKESFLVPKSFDVVGDIAIFNFFPEELKSKEKRIAECLLKLHKNIKVVAKKSGKYSGRLRKPKIAILAGEKRRETTHKESGCTFKLDIEKCYFSTRTGTERIRIAKQIKKGESVLVMFSGVGAFPIIISKNSKAKEIYGVELNKIAHKYAQENIKLNKADNVSLFQGNVKKITPKIKKKFDRILMPLPKTAENYIPLALKYLKQKGTIHLYSFAKEKEFNEIKERYKKKFKSVKIIKAGNYSPRVYRICLDLKA